MVDAGQLIAALGFLASVIGTLAGIIYRDLKTQLTACQEREEKLRASSETMLATYQARDAEERKAWQQWLASHPEAKP
jgi:hypothetical protein